MNRGGRKEDAGGGVEERGDSIALEAEEPGSDKTEVPRGATVSAFAPRSCRVLWRRSDARQKKGRTDGANTTLGQEGDMARNRTQKRTKRGNLKKFLTTHQATTFARQTFSAFWFWDDNSKKTNVVWFSNYSVFGVEPNTRRGPRRFSAPQWVGRPPFWRFWTGNAFLGPPK